MKSAAAAFNRPEAISRALKEYGGPIREKLAAKGIDVPANVDGFDDIKSFPDLHDGVPTAHIVAERETAAVTLRLHVLPQADDVFIYQDTESESYRYEVESGSLDRTLFRPCYRETTCEDYCICKAPTPECEPNCDGRYETEKRCCQNPDGSTDCETLDRTCTTDCGPYCG